MVKPGGSLDTNVILRFLLNDDKQQLKEAEKLIISPKSFRVSLLSIAEAVFVMEGKGFDRTVIKENLEALCSVANLHILRLVVLSAALLYSQRPALSFVDACLAFEAEVESAEPLWTFDKKLAKQAPHTKLIA